MTPRVELPIINEGVFLTLLSANSGVIEKASKSQWFFSNGNRPLFRQVADIVREAGGEAFRLYYQCGLCSGTCPSNAEAIQVKDTSELVHEAI